MRAYTHEINNTTRFWEEMAEQRIKKPSALGTDTVYYVDGNLWSDDINQAKRFPNLVTAELAMINNDGTNGGWTGAVVEEVS